MCKSLVLIRKNPKIAFKKETDFGIMLINEICHIVKIKRNFPYCKNQTTTRRSISKEKNGHPFSLFSFFVFIFIFFIPLYFGNQVRNLGR